MHALGPLISQQPPHYSCSCSNRGLTTRKKHVVLKGCRVVIGVNKATRILIRSHPSSDAIEVLFSDEVGKWVTQLMQNSLIESCRDCKLDKEAEQDENSFRKVKRCISFHDIAARVSSDDGVSFPQ
jgi:hypothetical protein